MEDIFMAALERMMALERAMAWLDQLVISPPTWPAVADTPSETKQLQVAVASESKQTQSTSTKETLVAPTAFTPLVVASSQREQTNTATNTYQRFAQMSKPMETRYNHWGGDAVQGQSSQAVQAQQSHQSWTKTVYPTTSQGVTAPARLSQQTQPISQAKETIVTISPTVYLQATVYEQADLDALVTKLNRLLEEEIAISAERAYT